LRMKPFDLDGISTEIAMKFHQHPIPVGSLASNFRGIKGQSICCEGVIFIIQVQYLVSYMS
jgi:hypothetical protein